MTDIAIFYGHAASNWGDLAINSGLVELLKQIGHTESEIRAIRLHPADRFDRISRESLGDVAVEDIAARGGARAGINELTLLSDLLAAPEKFIRKHRLRGADTIIINSGEHLFESASGEGLRDLIWRILPIICSNRAATPVVVMPSTVGPFRTELGEQLVTLLNRLPVAFAFRDRASSELLGSTPLAEQPVVLDPGFFAHGLEPRGPLPEEPRTVGLVFRLENYGLRAGSKRSAYVQAKHRLSSYRDSQAYQTFSRVAEEHLKLGRSIRLIVQTQADRELTHALYEELVADHPEADIRLQDPETFQEYLDQLRQLDVLVTSRFHAVILAEAQGVPAVGVYSESHGHKMGGLFALLGIPEASVRLDERLPEIVAEDIQTALRHSWSDREQRWERLEGLKEQTRGWLRDALTAERTGPIDTSRLQIQALAAVNRFLAESTQQDDLNGIRTALRRIEKTLSADAEESANPHTEEVADAAHA